MVNVLIIGSNFGAKTYLAAINKIYKNTKIDIVSPNIKKKKINPNIKKYKSYNKIIKNKKYNLIICATKPKIQNKFINFFISKSKKNKKTKLMLEKPLSENHYEIFKNLNNLLKNKIIFSQNFIFPKLNLWKNFSEFNKNKKNYTLYNWSFKQDYFLNKKKTWKTNIKQGGGILLYYFPHLIFNLLTLDSKIKFVKLCKVSLTKKLVTYLHIKFKSKLNKYDVKLNINSIIKIHSIKKIYKNNIIKLENTTKDWTKNFQITKNNKKILSSKETRIDLTKKNLQELMSFKFNSIDYLNFINVLYKTYKISNIIYKKIYDKK